MSPGGIVLKLAALLFAAALVFGFGWARGRKDWERPFRLAYHGMTACLVVATVLLFRAIFAHDFRYDYVIGYSSRDLPPMYLIASFWGGQEGTYLLWALFGALFGYLVLRGSWQRPAVMTGWTATVGVLVLFMLHPNADPFRLAAQVPPDGRGLNPLLQDPWMAFHPPVVFLGYAAMCVPGVLAWVAAFRRDEDHWANPALRWTLAGFFVLGTGIILGGVWAYKVLGWGGFWGWDPVENASLIPWITGTALLHGLLVQRSTGALRLSNLLLAMATYVLVLYSTFLTRSGVLADFSVHSFPKGTIYTWLLASLILSLVISAAALRRRRVREGTPMDMRVGWPLILSIAIVLFVVSALLVLIGTSWPILSSTFGKPSTPTAPFYNRVSLPIYVLLLAVLGLGPFLAWAPLPARIWIRRVLPSAGVAILGTVGAVLIGGRGAGVLALWFMALFALTSNLIRLVEVGRRRPFFAGAAISHVGFALMFLGIVAGEAWDRTQPLRLPLNEPVQVFDRTITYRGFVEGSQPKDLWGLSVRDRGGRESTAKVMMYELENGQLYRKPAIQRSLAGDLYLSPVSLEAPRGAESVMTLSKNDPLDLEGTTYTFLRYDMTQREQMMGGGGMTVNAILRVERGGRADTLSLPMSVGDYGMKGTPVELPGMSGQSLTFRKMSVEAGTVDVSVDRMSGGVGDSGHTEVLLLEASVKPFLWVLWAGTALLILGAIVAVTRRVLERRVPERVAVEKSARVPA